MKLECECYGVWDLPETNYGDYGVRYTNFIDPRGR